MRNMNQAKARIISTENTISADVLFPDANKVFPPKRRMPMPKRVFVIFMG